ncbi:MAG TPA: undecaprenyl-diphosphatase UppP [Limnochordales bacterium]|nr:undecaprenyl-diphosphatase UppP [Limnochordales bacterium]
MTAWQAIVLGLVQGLTEFLPVSSSGHLVIVRQWLGVTEYLLTFDAMVHFGSLLAVVLYFREELLQIVAGVVGLDRPGAAEGRRMFWLLVAASLPVAAVGLLLRDAIEQAFSSVAVPAIMLFVTGVLLIVADRVAVARRGSRPGWRHAVAMGLGQALAVVPGLSRSGTTMSAGILAGLTRPAAARFAFLMSVPAILGATALEMAQLLRAGPVEAEGVGILLLGTAVSAVSSYGAIALFLRYLQRRRLAPFAYYTWAVGALVLWLTL